MDSLDYSVLAEIGPCSFSANRRLILDWCSPDLTRLCDAIVPGARIDEVFVTSDGAWIPAAATVPAVGSRLVLRSSGQELVGKRIVRPQNLLFVGSMVSSDPIGRIDPAANSTVPAPAGYLGQDVGPALRQLHDRITDFEAVVSRRQERVAAEHRLARRLGSSGDLLVHTDAAGRILEFRSPRRDLFDLPGVMMIGQPVSTILPACWKHIRAIQAADAAHDVSFSLTVPGARLDGSLGAVGDTGFLILARDVTDQRDPAAATHRETLRDSLTDLPNRTCLEECIREEYASSGGFAVLMVDIDNFKNLNDVFGHQFGDRVLTAFASRLRECLRDGDRAARLGADQFAVLLKNVSTLEAVRGGAERIQQSLNRALTVGRRSTMIAVSVGVAVSGQKHDAASLLSSADIALHRAKATKNCVVVFDDVMYQAFIDRACLQVEVVNALKGQQILPYYQPVFDLQTMQSVGTEALARWVHPARGVLSPFVFLDAVEEAGAAAEFGEQMLMRACVQTRTLNNRIAGPALSVNVNVSPSQVQSSDIVAMVSRALALTGVDPGLVCLEITEKAIFADFDRAERTFRDLKQLGITVALDDFGVGYSSLRYLESFPIDVLKLDRAFIRHVGERSRRGRLVEAIVDLGKALDLKMVAEGIEHQEHAERLRDMGCPLGQGYLHSLPLPFPKLAEFIAAERDAVPQRCGARRQHLRARRATLQGSEG